ncbi:glycerol-3-phosphate dehydrogenase subunit GlpB [Halegenticoccus tardaugens]|uniref:glycerol-3-phosphate dehydrogenase subunit GlpB n=1 Tax=Halegenticoccus tardaugens TaxID=2071624 RepID=UPI00100A84D5|nr:glycerol-3-phosphate dehydrogenase subunit GlpB [Halegenticoccus tardaugens]
MPISEDVLVVGGGLAGSAAALSAAETGASVRLVSYKKSTLRFASGLVDALGYAPNGDGPIADPFEAIAELPADHPYGVVGADAVREGLALFDEVTGDAYRGGHTDANALVLTHGGTIKPTARYPARAASGLASDSRDALLVGFESLTDFDAPLAARHLSAAGVPFSVEGVTVSFPRRFRADAKLTRFSRSLDRDERADGTRVRRALAETVAPHLGSAERVGFPALLGDERADEVRAELAAELGAAVFEVPTGPPSLLGLALEDRLYEALDEAGVRISTGNPVVDYEADGGRVRAVYVDRKGQRVPYHAEQFVLATGGLVGKGIDSDRERVREPIFDCRVPHAPDRYDWFDGDAFGDHAFARFGVVPDAELRPTDEGGDARFSNLRAAGSVLGGADFAAEKSGGGVSLATGLVAGRNAGEATT